jgi:hypothetical protein
MINCEFSEPLMVLKAGEVIDFVLPDKTNANFEYSKISCIDNATSSTSTLALPDYITKIVSSSTPTRTFYISNTIDLGQILMLGFFVFFVSFSIINIIKKIIFKK